MGSGVASRSQARSEKRLATLYRDLACDRRPAFNRPIVQIYPGAWQRGAPDDDAVVARMLASLGYVVFAIDYRLAPAARWPAQIEDVRSALRWIETHGAEHGGDVTRMALLGRSSGAHLALLAAYADPPPGLRAVVAFYAPTDLAEGWRHPPSPDPLDVRARARDLHRRHAGSVRRRVPGGVPRSPSSVPARCPRSASTARRDHIVEPRFGRAARRTAARRRRHVGLSRDSVGGTCLRRPAARRAAARSRSTTPSVPRRGR